MAAPAGLDAVVEAINGLKRTMRRGNNRVINAIHTGNNRVISAIRTGNNRVINAIRTGNRTVLATIRTRLPQPPVQVQNANTNPVGQQPSTSGTSAVNPPRKKPKTTTNRQAPELPQEGAESSSSLGPPRVGSSHESFIDSSATGSGGLNGGSGGGVLQNLPPIPIIPNNLTQGPFTTSPGSNSNGNLISLNLPNYTSPPLPEEGEDNEGPTDQYENSVLFEEPPSNQGRQPPLLTEEDPGQAPKRRSLRLSSSMLQRTEAGEGGGEINSVYLERPISSPDSSDLLTYHPSPSRPSPRKRKRKTVSARTSPRLSHEGPPSPEPPSSPPAEANCTGCRGELFCLRVTCNKGKENIKANKSYESQN